MKSKGKKGRAREDGKRKEDARSIMQERWGKEGRKQERQKMLNGGRGKQDPYEEGRITLGREWGRKGKTMGRSFCFYIVFDTCPCQWHGLLLSYIIGLESSLSQDDETQMSRGLSRPTSFYDVIPPQPHTYIHLSLVDLNCSWISWQGTCLSDYTFVEGFRGCRGSRLGGWDDKWLLSERQSLSMERRKGTCSKDLETNLHVQNEHAMCPIIFFKFDHKRTRALLGQGTTNRKGAIRGDRLTFWM
jgi:hypothetical protein